MKSPQGTLTKLNNYIQVVFGPNNTQQITGVLLLNSLKIITFTLTRLTQVKASNCILTQTFCIAEHSSIS